MSLQAEIIERLQNNDQLPSPPGVVHKLLDLISQKDTNVDQISEIIAYDPAVSASVLRLANSVTFSGPEKISSIDEAILRIGFSALKDIVMSLSVINVFKKPQHIDYKDFWKHSLAVAYGSQMIEGMVNKSGKPAQELYMCGLLHDIGILILDQFLGDYYPSVLEKAATFQQDLQTIELEMLGIDHATVGAILMKRWQLPQVIIDSVRYHHEPLAAEQANPKLTKYVHVTNFICNTHQIRNGVKAIPEKFLQPVWFEMKLSLAQTPSVIQSINKKLNLANDILAALG